MKKRLPIRNPSASRRVFLKQAAGAAFGAAAIRPAAHAHESGETGAGRPRDGETRPAAPNPAPTTRHLLGLPQTDVHIDARTVLGPLEWWRHTVGQGGVNSLPLPPRVQEGVRKLQPRLVRIFLQEFFAVYPGHNRFDWSRLDPYMKALAHTGAKVVASVCIKPKRLFPKIDQAVWQPTDVAEWQNVLFELALRYSVQQPVITHWEIGNETDIGEDGGTPYLVQDPEAYTKFYRMAIEPIRKAFPGAKVGGPAIAAQSSEPMSGFVRRCAQDGVPLDFISWHRYDDDPAGHAGGVEKAKQLLVGFPGKRPEMMVTEWSKGFDKISVEELAFDPARAAIVAASILSMLDAGLDWSFYYHIWDQFVERAQFEPFFSPKGVDNMARHWNEIPHRFGLFGVGEEVRPQYFVFQMLSRLGDERIAIQYDDPHVRALSARTETRLSALFVNHTRDSAQDKTLSLRFSGVEPGRRILTTYRIDSARRWSADTLELLPVERRTVDTGAEFRCQVYCPADTVTMVAMERAP